MIDLIFWKNGFNFKEIGVAEVVHFAVINIFGIILPTSTLNLYRSNLNELF